MSEKEGTLRIMPLGRWAKALLLPFQILAFVGFALSLVVHVSSIFGIKVFDGAKFLELGIFIVFFLAMFVNLGTFRKLGPNRKDAWKILLRGCPDWMRKVLMALVAYAVFNVALFMILNVSRHAPSKDDLSLESVHWMLFYWASFSILYSRTHMKGFIIPPEGE